MTLVSTQYLRTCTDIAKKSDNALLDGSFASQDIVRLLRGLSLGGEFISFAMGKKKPLNLKTMEILHTEEQPQMVRLFDTVDRIVQGSKLLQDGPIFVYDSENGRLSLPNDISLFRAAQSWFLQKTRRHLDAVFEHEPVDAPSVDDFKRLAIAAFKMLDISVERDWNALLADDIRWCFACHPQHRAQMMHDWPQTQSLLDAFDLHCQLFSVSEALTMVWPLSTASGPTELLALPSLGTSVLP